MRSILIFFNPLVATAKDIILTNKKNIKMRVLKLVSLLILAIAFLFTSCERDNIEEVIETTEEQAPKVENNIVKRLVVSSPDGLDLGCLTIAFPFEMETINENIVEVNSIEDFEEALLDEDDYIIDFVYPLTVVTEDDETIEAANIDEIGELFASCIPDTGWGGNDFPAFLIDSETSCFEIVYPIDLVDIDENTITVESEVEFVDALAANELLFFDFPFSLTSDSTGVVEVANSDELFQLLSSCEYIGTPCDSITWGGDLGCYTIAFPVSFEMLDGTIETANDLDELNGLFFGGQVANFAFPLDLVDNETGELVTVNNDEELEDLLDECFIDVGGQDGIPGELLTAGSEGCYEIVYPLTGMTFNGDVVEIENEESLIEYNLNGGVFIDLPLELILEIDGETTIISISTIEAFVEILTNC